VSAAQVTTITMSDSNGNTYVPFMNSAIAVFNPRISGFHSIGGNHTNGMTVTVVAPSGAPGMACLAFSNVASIDQEAAGNGVQGTTVQPGALTPTHDGSLLVTFWGASTGAELQPFVSPAAWSTVIPFQSTLPFAAGGSYAIGASFLVQETAASANPTWNRTGGGAFMATIMVSLNAVTPSGGHPIVIGGGIL